MTSIVTPTNAFRTHSMTRRQVLSTGTSAGAALAASACADVGAAPTQAESGGSDRPAVSFTLNGARVECAEDARRTLLDQLREAEGLTGTKVGCRHGQCGACTVHIEGDPHLACRPCSPVSKAARSPPSRDWPTLPPGRVSPRRTACTPSKPLSSNATPFSAAIARPARS